MRHLLLSDIHANITALDAALAAAEGQWDKVVCLGDVVDYGPDPNETVDRIRALGAVTIRGNHDKAVTGLLDAEDFNPFAQAAVYWTREHLRPETRAYLERLPKGPLTTDGFTIVHGAFHDEDEYVYSPELALDGLTSSPTQIAFFGHTHIQGGFRLRGEVVGGLDTRPEPGESRVGLRIEKGSTYLLNPGSIGQPRDGDPRCAFAIADLKKKLVEFWRIPYDIESVQARMTDAGLPETLILRLSFGR